MKEQNFNTEIVRSIKSAGHFAYKLSDMPRAFMVTRFVPEKPCDILACIGGTMVAIEGKQFKKYQGFSLRFLRPSQIESLDHILKCGGQAYIFLNIRIPAEKGVSKSQNRLIVIDWSEWDKQLIPVKKMKELHYVEGKKGEFDLTRFFNRVENSLGTANGRHTSNS